ncbi:ATP-binding cassette domain-containing protein [Pseudofrankia inefficax]|uniref:ABC transporter related protein n=1 Tax=Pseudofrankia inefficax (strain DSM 45817 / CECT 9037 / DDB 130130 / EuI1c) TaxID=298654 RepID=E3JC85_PSEI1|nr:ATP-binding cassette domain-containing protein [Pseudofrankia inefficax]ADP83541.1 ABC transporter related protein [Pseudofrankia inefficax]
MTGGLVETTGTLNGAVRGRPRLECVDVTVRFGGLVAVDKANLAVPAGTIVGLVGPNGAGKSTLFGVLSGLIRPANGKVLLEGEDITGTTAQSRAASGIARTFQHTELFDSLTVRDHLVLAYRAKHEKSRVWTDLFTIGSLRPASKTERETVDELIEQLGLVPVRNRPALGLPLGTARMLELGRALATSPRVLLLDEPSSGLDPNETAQMEEVLRRVVDERGISALLVEHDVELVMRLSSAVYVLEFGKMIASGPPEQVRNDPAVRAAYLGEEVSSEATASVAAEASEFGGLTKAAPAGPVAPATTGGPLLTVENLSLHYGDALALNGISFTLAAGKALAVLGANGAGKSSLARAVSGLVPTSGGKILLGGEDVSGWPAHRVRKSALVHLPEGRGVFRGLTVIDNLKMAAAVVPGRKARKQAVDLALEIFPVFANRRRQSAGLLSGGEQQMLSLARALATAPKLVIADEMSLGLAPKMVDLVFDGLDRARQAGVTVIMIEQYVHRALAFADEALVMHRGEIAWAGPTSAAHGEVLRHYLGDATTAEA